MYIVSLLQNEQQKRLVINFDDIEIAKLNKNITKIVISITSQIKSYEKLIKEFSKQNMENGIINNIKLNHKKRKKIAKMK